MGRLEEAQRCLEESLAIARELGDRNRIAAAVQSLGYACQTAGDLGRARQLFDEGVELARDVGDTRQIAAALICLGQLLRQQRDFGGAEQLYREATDIARRLGDEESVGIGLLNLAMVAIECGRLQEARPLLRDAVVTALATGSQMLGQAALDVMSGYSAADGHMESCAHYYGASEAQAVRSGLQRDPTDAGFLMPRLEAARAQLGDRFALLRDEGTQWSCEDALRRAVAELP
jgi:tetratricopeptide (TPR) repeat protein